MGCDLASLQYLRRWKSLNQMSNSSGTPDYSSTGSGMSTVKSVSMFTNLMAQSSKFVMEGVKNLVVKRHNLPVTKIVDELMEIKQGQHQEEYRYFDPKILRGQDNIPRAKNPFQVIFPISSYIKKPENTKFLTLNLKYHIIDRYCYLGGHCIHGRWW